MIIYANDRAALHCGDALSELRGMADNSVSMCVTSPPYWSLRAYGTEPQVWLAPGSDPGCDHEWGEEVPGDTRGGSGTETGRNGRGEEYGRNSARGCWCQRCGAWRGELGLEPSFSDFLVHLVAIFDEVRRVLHPSGTCWINMGSSYSCAPNGRSAAATKAVGRDDRTFRDKPRVAGGRRRTGDQSEPQGSSVSSSAGACGSDGRALADSPGPDSVCSGLCDECLIAWSRHISSTSRQHLQSALLGGKKGRGSAIPGSSDGRSSLPGVPASTTLSSWLNARGACVRCSNRAELLSASHSASADALASVHKEECRPGTEPSESVSRSRDKASSVMAYSYSTIVSQVKSKDELGQHWALAFALRAAGWYLRDAIVWSKPSPMPSSVTDRFTNSYEMVFLLSKSPRYHFDAYATRERAREEGWRNKRNVWSITAEASHESHFASYPRALVQPMVMAGTSERGCCSKCLAQWKRIVRKSGGTTGKDWNPDKSLETGNSAATRADNGDGSYRVESLGFAPSCKCSAPVRPAIVLDIFSGTGTTGVVALELGRHFVGVELSPRYCKIAKRRLQGAKAVLPGLVDEGGENLEGEGDLREEAAQAVLGREGVGTLFG